VQNNIGEEEATLVLRHEIGGTSVKLCVLNKQSTFIRLLFTQQKLRYGSGRFTQQKLHYQFPRASGTEE